MRALGLDTSKWRTGWAVVETPVGETTRLVASGALEFRKTKASKEELTPGIRYTRVEGLINELVAKYAPDAAGYEALHVMRNMWGITVLAGTIGVAQLCLFKRMHIEAIEVKPTNMSSMCSQMLGAACPHKARKGGGQIVDKKPAARMFCKQVLKTPFTEDTQDEADAAVVAYCLLHTPTTILQRGRNAAL